MSKHVLFFFLIIVMGCTSNKNFFYMEVQSRVLGKEKVSIVKDSFLITLIIEEELVKYFGKTRIKLFDKEIYSKDLSLLKPDSLGVVRDNIMFINSAKVYEGRIAIYFDGAKLYAEEQLTAFNDKVQIYTLINHNMADFPIRTYTLLFIYR